MEGKLLREGRERARGVRSQVLASPSCLVVVSASQRTLSEPMGGGTTTRQAAQWCIHLVPAVEPPPPQRPEGKSESLADPTSPLPALAPPYKRLPNF